MLRSTLTKTLTKTWSSILVRYAQTIRPDHESVQFNPYAQAIYPDHQHTVQPNVPGGGRHHHGEAVFNYKHLRYATPIASRANMTPTPAQSTPTRTAVLAASVRSAELAGILRPPEDVLRRERGLIFPHYQVDQSSVFVAAGVNYELRLMVVTQVVHAGLSPL